MSKKIFDNPNTLLKEDLNELFKKKQKGDLDILFETVNLLMYKNQHNDDMVCILKSCGLDTFTTLVNLFDGKSVNFLREDELIDNLIVAIVYFYRKVKGITDWDEIESYFNDRKLDRLSIAHKIHGLDQFTKQKIHQLWSKELGVEIED